MTWDELANFILTQIPPERRLDYVRFVEPYDSFKVYQTVNISRNEAGESVVDEDGNTVQPGQFYLET